MRDWVSRGARLPTCVCLVGLSGWAILPGAGMPFPDEVQNQPVADETILSILGYAPRRQRIRVRGLATGVAILAAVAWRAWVIWSLATPMSLDTQVATDAGAGAAGSRAPGSAADTPSARESETTRSTDVVETPPVGTTSRTPPPPDDEVRREVPATAENQAGPTPDPVNVMNPVDLVEDVSPALVDSVVPHESVGSTTIAAPAERADRLNPAPAPSLEPGPVVSEVFATALALQRASDVVAAVAAYETLLAGGMPRAQVHNNLGLLYQQQNRFADAPREYQSAMAIDPRHSKAKNNLGVVRMRQARHEDAAAAFRGARWLDPTNLDAWVNLALALQAAGDSVMARRTLIDALSVDARHATTHYNLARLFEGDGDIPRNRALRAVCRAQRCRACRPRRDGRTSDGRARIPVNEISCSGV